MPDPATWMVDGAREMERRFALPPNSVSYDTSTDHYDTEIPGDPSAYIMYTVGRTKPDTLHDPLRLDHRPDLWVTFETPATNAIGYTQGRVSTWSPYILAIWQTVPAQLPLRLLKFQVKCGDEVCGGPYLRADSLDVTNPRRR